MKKILFSIIAIVMGGFMISTPVFALNDCTCTRIYKNGTNTVETGHVVPAAFIRNICECGHGESVMKIILYVVDILSIGVGILGVIGISIVGIQYLTAGGNEEKTRKAKRRMLEIVLGLAVYVILYAILRWLNVGI